MGGGLTRLHRSTLSNVKETTEDGDQVTRSIGAQFVLSLIDKTILCSLLTSKVPFYFSYVPSSVTNLATIQPLSHF